MPPKEVRFNNGAIKCNEPYTDPSTPNILFKLDSVKFLEYLDKPIKDWNVYGKRLKNKEYPCEANNYITINPETEKFCCITSEKKKDLETSMTPEDKYKIQQIIEKKKAESRKWVRPYWEGRVDEMWRRNTIILDKPLLDILEALPGVNQLQIKGVVVLQSDKPTIKKINTLNIGDILDLSSVNSYSKTLGKLLASNTNGASNLTEEEAIQLKSFEHALKTASESGNTTKIQNATQAFTKYKQTLDNTHNELIKLLQQTILGSLKTSGFRPDIYKRKHTDFAVGRADVFAKYDIIKSNYDEIKKITEGSPANLTLANEQYTNMENTIGILYKKLESELKFENDIEDLVGINGQFAKTRALKEASTEATTLANTILSKVTEVPQKHVNIFIKIVYEMATEAKELIDNATKKLEKLKSASTNVTGATSATSAKGGYRRKKSRKKNRRTRISKKKRNYKKRSNRRKSSRKAK
jgi:hypothetical protein